MLTVNSVSYGYTKKRKIISNISFDLQPGTIYGLLGLNGEGKTTLIKLMEGLLLPKKGDIKFGGINSKDRSGKYFDQVFYLGDTTTLPYLYVHDFGRMYGNFYSNFNYSEFENYLQEFQIDPNSHLSSLSLGQGKKVHLAFGLACNTAVLLMDEPTNGLDIPSKTIFRRLLANCLTPEKTVVIASHQIRDIDQLLDHLLILHHGELILDKSLSDINDQYAITSEINPGDEIIFQTEEVVGNKYLIVNRTEATSNMDIEFLFNAFIHSSKTTVK